MAIVRYKAYDASGAKVHGELEVSDTARVPEILHKRGLLVYQTVDVSRAPGLLPRFGWLKFQSSLSLGDHTGFARQLAALQRADLPLDQSLRLLAAQSGKSRLGTFATEVAGHVTAGRPLSAAIATAAPDAPGLVVPLVRAGEARGALGQCLTDLAEILERRVELQRRLQGAFIYPAILLVVALVAVSIVVGVLVPTLLPLFSDNGVDPPLILKLAGGVSEVITHFWQLLVAVFLAFIALVAYFVRLPSVRRWRAKSVLRIPAIGALVQRTNTAIMARTLGTLLRNGVPLVSALGLAASVMPNVHFTKALETTTEAVKEGKRLSQMLRQTQLFPDLALQFISVGEDSSKLDDMLLHLADIEDAQNKTQIETLLTLLTPMITLVVGAIVAGLILTVMQAVMSVNEIVK
jgi:general secretion pathway protein F